MWYLSATAYNAAGESGFSTEVASWPRAVIASADPSQIEQGASHSVVVTGVNFREGDAIGFSHPGIQVDGFTVNSCNQITVNITVAGSASPGTSVFQVTHPSGVSGSVADLLTVVEVLDETAPVIDAIQAADVDGTSATISWTTDEPADSNVFYRKDGQTEYTVVSASDLVTAHTVQLTGLEPETTYEYHVGSTDAAGNTTTSPDDTFTTSESPFAYLRFEAESGVLVDPVRTASGSGAFGEAWIDTPSGTAAGSTSDPAGTATFGVNIPETGTWFIWVRMYGENSSSDSWFESIDGAARAVIDVSVNGEWNWVAGRSYELNQGLHSVELGGRESESRADRILLTNDPGYIPTEQPGADSLPPARVTELTATPADDQVDLSWTNPNDVDYTTTIVRYRTDGQFPTSPVDGMSVTEQGGAPGSSDSFTHQGTSPGVVYHYSAFAIDAEGNVAEAAHAQVLAINVPDPPSGLVVN